MKQAELSFLTRLAVITRMIVMQEQTDSGNCLPSSTFLHAVHAHAPEQQFLVLPCIKLIN